MNEKPRASLSPSKQPIEPLTSRRYGYSTASEHVFCPETETAGISLRTSTQDDQILMQQVGKSTFVALQQHADEVQNRIDQQCARNADFRTSGNRLAETMKECALDGSGEQDLSWLTRALAALQLGGGGGKDKDVDMVDVGMQDTETMSGARNIYW